MSASSTALVGGPAKAVTCVIVRVGPQGFALPLASVDRALRMAACRPVPEGPAWLVGLLDVAGVILPVVDLGSRLGLAPQTPTPAHRLLLVRGAGRLYGLMVEDVPQVAELTDPPEPLPPLLPVTEARHLEGELIMVLDPERLLPAEVTA